MSDRQLEEIVKEYSDLAKDKNVDAASLMINALEQEDSNRVNPKWRRWAYLLSLTFPPIGLIFGLYYFFKEESDARTAAYWCFGLTVISIIGTIIFFQALLGASGLAPEQIQSIDPNEIYQLTQ